MRRNASICELASSIRITYGHVLAEMNGRTIRGPGSYGFVGQALALAGRRDEARAELAFWRCRGCDMCRLTILRRSAFESALRKAREPHSNDPPFGAREPRAGSRDAASNGKAAASGVPTRLARRFAA
jgi:hypothetical protein